MSCLCCCLRRGELEGLGGLFAARGSIDSSQEIRGSWASFWIVGKRPRWLGEIVAYERTDRWQLRSDRQSCGRWGACVDIGSSAATRRRRCECGVGEVDFDTVGLTWATRTRSCGASSILGMGGCQRKERERLLEAEGCPAEEDSRRGFTGLLVRFGRRGWIGGGRRGRR